MAWPFSSRLWSASLAKTASSRYLYTTLTENVSAWTFVSRTVPYLPSSSCKTSYTTEREINQRNGPHQLLGTSHEVGR